MVFSFTDKLSLKKFDVVLPAPLEETLLLFLLVSNHCDIIYLIAYRSKTYIIENVDKMKSKVRVESKPYNLQFLNLLLILSPLWPTIQLILTTTKIKQNKK